MVFLVAFMVMFSFRVMFFVYAQDWMIGVKV